MLKRYLLLGSALCFMAVGIVRCPFPFDSKISRPHLVQAPSGPPSAAATVSPRL